MNWPARSRKPLRKRARALVDDAITRCIRYQRGRQLLSGVDFCCAQRILDGMVPAWHHPLLLVAVVDSETSR